MNKKSQVSMFVIIVLVLMIGIFMFLLYENNYNSTIYSTQSKKVKAFSEMNIGLGEYLKSCANEAAKKGIEVAGINENTKGQFEAASTEFMVTCSKDLFARIKDRYTIEEGQIVSRLILKDETANLEITYPLKIYGESEKLSFDNFLVTLDLASRVKVSNGITAQELLLETTDKTATLKIPEGVKLTDSKGHKVESVGLKLKDKHFDNLENNLLIGNIAIEGQPDGLKFSEPVELSIKFDPGKIPEGSTLDNIAIGRWDEKFQVWRVLPTRIKNNVATADIGGFSVYEVGDFSHAYIFNPPKNKRQVMQKFQEVDPAKFDSSFVKKNDDFILIKGDVARVVIPGIVYGVTNPLTGKIDDPAMCEKFQAESDDESEVEHFNNFIVCDGVVPADPLAITDEEKDSIKNSKSCESKFPGNSCTSSEISGSGLCVKQDDGTCTCASAIPEVTTKIPCGCIGGNLDAFDSSYIAGVRFAPNGNSAIESLYTNLACTDPGQMIAYSDGFKLREFPEASGMVKGVRGAFVNNQCTSNADAEASCGVTFFVNGNGVTSTRS